MPSFTRDKLSKLKCDINEYPIFLETGTYYGKTIFEMEEYFKNLITIEIKEDLYLNLLKNYKGDKIKFINGESTNIFEHIFKFIQDDTIFFLDAHISATDSGYGNKVVPLLEEIDLINKNYARKGIIIISDVRLFGEKMGNEDWSEINKDKIFGLLFSRIKDFYYLDSEYSKDDFLIIHINSIN
jgi:hypothetical protein